jgi:hypothetical protein
MRSLSRLGSWLCRGNIKLVKRENQIKDIHLVLKNINGNVGNYGAVN